MENLLFCANHPGKIAKKHCNRCDLNLCNECIFESHIYHHEEITKIEYLINTKQNKVPEFLSKEIKLIIDKSFNDLKPQIYQLVEKETEQYIKDHKSLQLKVNQSKKGKQKIRKGNRRKRISKIYHLLFSEKNSKSKIIKEKKGTKQ